MNSLLLDDFVADALSRNIPTPSPREAPCPTLPGKATVAIGMRRSGKTFYLYEQARKFMAQGMERQGILRVNFEDDRLFGMQVQDVRDMVETYFRMFPDYRTKGCVFLFDEIQLIEGWERIIRTLLDQEKAQIFITGSSAKLLSKEIASSLRGRSLSVEIFPFSFREFLTFKKIAEVDFASPDAEARSRLQHEFRNYLTCGGFPEVIDQEPPIALQILQGYVDSVILRDVVERHRISSVLPLRLLIQQVLANAGSLFSIHKFYGDMKTRGIAIGKDTLYELFDHLEDAYLFQSVSAFNRSERVKQTRPKKVYSIDHGLAVAYARSTHRDLGRILEQAVFMCLRRLCQNIHYYRTAEGFEVDFLLGSPFENILVQVCADLSHTETREREVRALISAMRELGTSSGIIVSLDETQSISLEKGEIKVIPAWRFFIAPQNFFSSSKPTR